MAEIVSNSRKMRVIPVMLCVFLCAALTSSAPVAGDNSDLISYENVRTDTGYRFSYETKDGQAREEAGVFDPQTGVMTVTGWYSFRAPDGTIYRTNFIADENGYRIIGFPPVAPQLGAPISNTVLLSLVG